MHENYLRKVERVQEITQKHYESGRIDRCYMAVWRRYVYPVYPMCYETYRTMLKIDVQDERDRMKKAVDKPNWVGTVFEPLIA